MFFTVPCFASPNGLAGWYHGSFGYENALNNSKENETPLILFFFLDSDPLCQKLGEDYFSKYDVYNFLDDISKVDINLEGNDFEIELAKKYNIEKETTLLIVFPFAEADPVKTSPFMKEQDMTPEEFTANLKSIFSLTYNNIGYSFFENQDYENAIKYYSFSIKYDPDRAYSVFALGSVYHAVAIEEKDMEYFKKAEEYYMEALKLNPEYKECKEELKKLYENKIKLEVK